MNRTEKTGKRYLLLGILLMLQVIAAFCFCMKKTGFHYDEYYSYYSSNVTSGLVPTDREWKTGTDIRNEFAVLPQEKFNFPTVVRMQTYDVHPPFYYILLHAVCSLTPGVFSKWSALGLNLLFFIGSWCLLGSLAWRLTGSAGIKSTSYRMAAVAGVCLLYGFNPAVFSGIMLARMYMLLGFLILLVTWLHVRALEKRKYGWRFYLPVMVTVYLGFLTHYYFAVYLFFLAAAMEFYLLFEKADGKPWAGKWKDCIAYGTAAAGAMLLAVISYPACLGHIFRGYRGTEAMGAFFDPGNTLGRLRFFAGLLNEYAFGSMLPFLILVIILLLLTVIMLRRFCTVHRADQPFAERYRAILIPAAAAAGYFAVVTKTALLTAEEANRYQIPVYGLILLLTVTFLVILVQKIAVLLGAPNQKGTLAVKAGLMGLGVMFLLPGAGGIYGLTQNKVLFLYEEDAENIEYARQNHDVPIIYFYNRKLTWMIWDDSLELMQYDQIYFINMDDLSPIVDEVIATADRMLVYTARNENSREAVEMAAACAGGARAEKIRELLYCDLYEITE